MSLPSKTPLLENGMALNGRWEILEHLATGGKGEVYRDRQTNLDREVVVKTVSLDYLAEFGDDPGEVETELQRLHREAMAMAQVRHPYVVQVYDQDSGLTSRRLEPGFKTTSSPSWKVSRLYMNRESSTGTSNRRTCFSTGRLPRLATSG